MKLQPLISWWLLAPYIIAALVFAGWQFMGLRRKKQTKVRPVLLRWLRRSALLVLPAIVALGPSVQGGTSSPGVANLDVFFVVDTTPSMGALDYADELQRIEGAKQDILAIADSLRGAHMEVITFDTEANVILPLTTDSTAFSTAVQGITPQVYNYSQGSTIDKPISLVTQELKNSEDAFPDHFRLLFYLGDGEQTTETEVKSFEPLSRYLSGGAVLGYGTTKGAQMVKYTGLENSNTRPSYITTVDSATNQLVPAISKMDPAALRNISKQLKVTYQDRNSGGPVNELYQASQAALAIDRSQRVVHYLNLYWLFAVPYAGLLFWEWQTLIVKLFELRERKDKPERRGGKYA